MCGRPLQTTMPPLRAPAAQRSFLLGNLPELGTDILGFRILRAGHGDVAFSASGMAGVRAQPSRHIEQSWSPTTRTSSSTTFFWRHVPRDLRKRTPHQQGDFWLRQRRLAQPSFHRDRVAAYGDVMVAFTERALDAWRDGETRDLHQELMRLTLLIVAKVMFDADVADEVETIGGALDDATKEIASRFRRPFRIPDEIPIPGNLRYRRAVRRLDAVVHRIIDAHREHDGRGDLLGLLMQARDEDGHAMTDAQLRDEAITIMLAGTKRRRLRCPGRATFCRSTHRSRRTSTRGQRRARRQAPPSINRPAEASFHRDGRDEAMRLYPPAYALGREAIRDCTIAGYEVPAGTSIFISPWVVHRDARWFDRPGTSCRSDGRECRPPAARFAYFPFGGGPRIFHLESLRDDEAVLSSPASFAGSGFWRTKGRSAVSDDHATARQRLKMTKLRDDQSERFFIGSPSALPCWTSLASRVRSLFFSPSSCC